MAAIDWQQVRKAMALSRRELEVVQLLCNGDKIAAVGYRLQLGVGTVKTYCGRVYRKVGVSNHSELLLEVMAVALGRG